MEPRTRLRDDEFEGCDDDYEYWLHCEEQAEMEPTPRARPTTATPALRSGSTTWKPATTG